MPLDIAMLRKARPQNTIHYFPSIDSTMIEASRLATGGAPHGTAVIADEQTAGVGRLGRTWISAPDVGIYCSILLRLSLPPARIPIASLLLGLSVAEAIQKATSLVCDLRWPNDILIGERKVCGILTQLVDSCVVAGIGINVNQTEFPAGLRTPATSLRIESGVEQSRERLLIDLLDSVDSFCVLLQSQGPDAILRAFSAVSSYVNGRQVIVEEGGQRGVTAGLDDCGFLMLRTEDGRLQRLSAGGVRAATR
jgi:BirA family biotin operon repressor/biotin-[acetyl-CoA-carboxylase] ligase